MIPIKWRSDGHPTGLMNRVSSPSSPTVRGLMGTSIREFVHVLAAEFSSIHVLNLSGKCNALPRRACHVAEGGKRLRFSGSRAPVAIALLVKNPNATHEDCCKIQYHDIGDYLTRMRRNWMHSAMR